MAALLIIPLVGLSCFLLLAKSIFEKDKIAYVFDSSLSVTKTRAARVNSEIASVLSIAQAVVLSYRSDSKNLSETGAYYFEREEKIQAFQLYAWDPLSSGYERTVSLVKPNLQKTFKAQASRLSDALNEAKASDQTILIRGLDGENNSLILIARFGEVSDPHHVIASMVFQASELAQIFLEKSAYTSFLARRKDGRLVFTPATGGIEWSAVWQTLAKKTVPEGIDEIGVGAPPEKFLASFSDVDLAGLMVVSTVEKRAALSAVELLIKKSLLYFVVVISLTAIFALLTSDSLTFALSRLSSATQKVSEGNFDVRVDIKSGGEIGLLASSFNKMASEVSRLMKETAEKARMESELATAKAVQETLFPEPNAEFGPIQISGHYTPASECGGDWWHYCENADRILIWIGDATGHGAPAALLTSAARAVASVITMGPPMPAGDCLSILNRAICDTSKGKMMMTFFLACIDKSTGELSYANASHEPPLLLHKPSSYEVELKRDDFIPLNEINNPRLGEQPDHVFKQSKFNLLPGDVIVFYTDGVVDVKSPEGKNFGERRFLKALATQLGSADTNAQKTVSGVVNALESFRTQTPLDDDVTLIVCRYDVVGGVGGKKTEAA